ncbi:hypothetical protein [Kibdelosporangium phytohabitans]|nr:hypothetical protein [Kibdelosporangium phytohabitans]MBE1467548.1 hypothetical protein [Kibdelosporangium phytohabitans]
METAHEATEAVNAVLLAFTKSAAPNANALTPTRPDTPAGRWPLR